MSRRVPGVVLLGLAATYGGVAVWAAPRSGVFVVVVALLVALMVAAGVALIAGLRAGRPLGRAVAVALVAAGVAATIALTASVAWLHGVYGSVGRGLAVAATVVAVLVLQITALPALWLWRRLRR
jgi:hypothetical protein